MNTSVQNKLEQPEIQEAIVSFLQNLPTYEKQIQQIGQLANFSQAILSDKEALQTYDQIIRTYNINLETIEAIIQLLEKLPRLIQTLEQLENMIDFVSSVLRDETTLNNITESLKEYTNPVVEKGQTGISLLKEIQKEAEATKEPIKLTTIYKWLKDPTVQKSLKYVQATLTVLSKKS